MTTKKIGNIVKDEVIKVEYVYEKGKFYEHIYHKFITKTHPKGIVLYSVDQIKSPARRVRELLKKSQLKR